MNFLVVEDEYYARKALAQSVQHWQQGAVVDEADNGLAALDMLSRKSYDVALLDIKMPRMNGLDLAEKMQSACPQTYKIMITGYGEFEYAQAAIRFNVSDYLLKPVDDDKLCDSLIRAQEYVEELKYKRRLEEEASNDGRAMRRQLFLHHLHDWLDGDGAQETPRELAEMGFSSCMAARLWDESGATDAAAIQRRLERDACARWFVLPAQGKDVCALACYKGDAPARADRIASLADVRADLNAAGLRVRAAMSGGCAISRAPHAASQARAAMDYRLLRGDGLLAYGLLKEQTRYVTVFDAAETADFSMMLAQSRAEDASHLALQMLDALAAAPQASIVSLRDLLSRLCTCMNRAIAQALLEDGVESELLQVSIDTGDFLTLAQLRERVREVIGQVCGLSGRVATSSADKMVDYIQQYIQEHLSENITLKELASTRLYLNPSYLSRLFKAKTGISYKRYLTQMRLDKACRMLASHDKSVMSIANECGYADASQFVQLFRKHFGVTPSVYRDTHVGYQENTWLKTEEDVEGPTDEL